MNLIEDQNGVTHKQIFGSNIFDPATGIHKVLSGGIADGMATAIDPASFALDISFLPSDQVSIIVPPQLVAILDENNLRSLFAFDQLGAPRATAGAVTYGAVEEAVPPATYAVTYNANATGVTNMPANQTKTENVALTLRSTVPARSGYTFKGWATTSGGAAQYQPGDSYTANAALTLYAVWDVTPPATYAVTYNANASNVTNMPANQTKTENVALTLSSTVPVRTGYTFKGWATTSGATVAQYQPGDSYTANAAVALYAVWAQNASPPKIIPGTSYEATFFNWILFIVVFGWIWMRF